MATDRFLPLLGVRYSAPDTLSQVMFCYTELCNCIALQHRNQLVFICYYEVKSVSALDLLRFSITCQE